METKCTAVIQSIYPEWYLYIDLNIYANWNTGWAKEIGSQVPAQKSLEKIVVMPFCLGSSGAVCVVAVSTWAVAPFLNNNWRGTYFLHREV